MSVVRLRPTDLRDALASNGTSLQFQVQVHVPTASLAGVEAFVRWPHAVLGMVGPQEIVQLVEQGGLHGEFDEWVIGAACVQTAAWRKQGVPLPLTSVNVFEATLRRPDLLRTVTAAVERAPTPPGTLELELPRGAALDGAFVAIVGSLRTRGIRVAADARDPDDVPRVDVDTLKLPYALTSRIDEPARAAAAAEIVRRAKARGMRVVAEGVETAAQQAAILATGCEIVQGYVFGPEASASEVSALAQKSG